MVELHRSQQSCGIISLVEIGDGVTQPGVVRCESALLFKQTVPPPVAFLRASEGASVAIPADLDLTEQVEYHYFRAASGQI